MIVQNTHITMREQNKMDTHAYSTLIVRFCCIYRYINKYMRKVHWRRRCNHFVLLHDLYLYEVSQSCLFLLYAYYQPYAAVRCYFYNLLGLP